MISLFEEYGVKFAYLFGSRAKGDRPPSSDVDLAVYLGESEPGRRFDKKLSLISRLGVIVKKDVDVVVLNDVRNNFLLAEIIRKGKVIFNCAPDERFAFAVAKQHEVTDFITHFHHVATGTNFSKN
ncbi:MAG: nucleotidyltransferase domain-containing protein [Nitrospinae bacterium]|nr:nucleotidyltransferase domain-containing protein [Nitrospinota bacterium]